MSGAWVWVWEGVDGVDAAGGCSGGLGWDVCAMRFCFEVGLVFMLMMATAVLL